MLRILLPVLAIALLGTSGCVAAAIVGAAGAGYGYTQANKKSGTPVEQHGSTQPAKETTQPATPPANGMTPPAKTPAPPEGVKLLPAPGEFVDCRLENGQHLAMSAADCRAKGGTTS